MVCDPNDNTLNPPNFGPPPDGYFGPIFAPPQIPFPDISLPEGIPNDILDILNQIFLQIPGGRIIPNVDGAFDSVYDAVGKLMNAFAPYMAFYSFIQALLNIIICIIEVLCALINPFKVIKAIRRLFKQCIPDFLSMFPWIALIAMILAFILMLLALIEYLINTIIALINDIIANITALAEAVQIGHEEGIIAVTTKLSSLLCFIEQLFAMLIAFQVIFVIIKALAELGGSKPCKRKGGDCCDDEVCPPFIGDFPDGTTGVFGRLIYHNRINLNVSTLGIPALEDLVAPLRTERWQFVDDLDSPQYPFNDIITPINDNIFWPQGLVLQKGDNLKNTVPYTVNLRLALDPSVFVDSNGDPINSNNGSFTGYRYFRVDDVILVKQPYNGLLNYENNLDFGDDAPPPLTGTSFGDNDGTIRLVGGLVYEDDGVTPFNVDGEQATIDTFIHRNTQTSNSLPSSEDGYQISNIEWNLKPNHPVLMKYQLITAGCQPDIQAETNVVDLTIPDPTPVIDILGEEGLPDLDTALECLNTAINDFRKDVSLEKAAVFQNSVVGCLEDLRDQSIRVFERGLAAGVSTYQSEFTLDPEIQFIDRPIQVAVTLKDAGGNELANNIPSPVDENIASLLKGKVTFGSISDFSYDGYSLFLADITSSLPGSGTAQVSFDGDFLSEVLNQDDIDAQSEISIITLPYQFVGGDGGGVRPDPLARRDETDVSNNE